jgi:hypothetical protein
MNINQINEVSIIKKLLSVSIINYRDRNPQKYSYRYISNKSNVSASFIERAAKNRLGDPLDFKKILAIANVVCDKETQYEIAERYLESALEDFDDLQEKFLKRSGILEDIKTKRKIIPQLVDCEFSYIIYTLATSEVGVSKEELIEILGSQSITKAEQLIKDKLIYFKNEKYHAYYKAFSLPIEQVNKVANFLIKHYKIQNYGKERNYIHVHTTSLNRNGVKKLQKEHRELHNKTIEIKRNYSGNIQVFSIGVLDTFTTKEIE